MSPTAPYMHDGPLARLEDVIDYYDRGGNPNPRLDPELRPLRLTAAEKTSLVSFLRALSGRIIGALDGISTESSRRPDASDRRSQ